VLRRRYDTVFLTHSFGMVRTAFNAGETLRSRDWANFKPGESSHETVFNLEAAEALMGVPFDEDDAHHPFVADIDYHWPAGNVVGVHGGSKEGYWASKRWGGFPELAARLTARGYEVRSFGTPEEHVPGTRDMTGGSIEEMTLALRDCAYFVSNDSGVMNLANALGVPVTAVFGPTDIATRRPLRPWNVVVGPEGGGPATEVADPKLFKSGGCTSIDTVTVDRVMAGFDRMVDRVRAAREALAS
jgi:ADP-heptose:LPS heptosyltransferase